MGATKTILTPKWPAKPVDPLQARVSYDVVADEFLVYFGGKPVPKTSDPLDAPEIGHVAIMIGLDAEGEETGEIVGIHVIPMLLGAVEDKPSWAALAWAAMTGYHGTELLRERLPGFVAEVREAFEEYWTPAPPIEEQLAVIERARQERDSAPSTD